MTPIITAAVVVGLGVFALGFVAVISRFLGVASAKEKEAAADLSAYRTFCAKRNEPLPIDDLDGSDDEVIDDRIRMLLAARRD